MMDKQPLEFDEIIALALSERVSHVDNNDRAIRAASEMAREVVEKFDYEAEAAAN